MPSVAEAEPNACGDLLKIPEIRPAFEFISVLLMTTTFKDKEKVLVGIISDTHGMLMPEVVQALKDVDLIIHAGDIGHPEVLDDLRLGFGIEVTVDPADPTAVGSLVRLSMESCLM